MTRRIKAVVLASVFLALSAFGSRPADAMTCAPDLEDACRVAATVICGVVAKGQPCLA
jgi:hypothetical protein